MRYRLSPRSIVVVLLVAVGLACSADTTGRRAEAIYQPDSTDPGTHPQVSFLEIDHVTSTKVDGCTGTLIASDVILTAAHCFEPDIHTGTYAIRVFVGHNATSALRSALLEVPGVDGDVAPWTGASGAVPSVTASPSAVLIHPNWSFSTRNPAWDVALVVLDTPIPHSLIEPLRVIAGGYYPSPPLSSEFEGIERWNGIFVRGAGAGHTDMGCDDGAWSPVSTLEVMMYEPGFEEGGAFYQMNGGMGGAGPSFCHADSGGPIVTAPAGDDPFGTNLTPWEVISVLSVARNDTQCGPALQEAGLRPWLIAHALDADGDGLEPPDDNCDSAANATQDDNDGDGDGDPCDTDDDEDGILDDEDNCPKRANPDQTDWDGDGRGFNCDPDEHDLDGDLVPTEDDNCPRDPNPYQENCNLLAERLHFAGSSGEEIGDACDPVPCATAFSDQRTFIEQTTILSGTAMNMCIEHYGRSIADIVRLEPTRGTVYGAHATTDLEIWFCPCEASDPRDCDEPPWNCELAEAPSLTGSSDWLALSLTDVLDVTEPVPQPLSLTYVPWVSIRPRESFGWDYVTDHANWVLAQGIWTPTPSSASLYGPGTDMRGLLWVEDPTSEGLWAHQADFCGVAESCTMASNYLADVAPDRAVHWTSCTSLPEYAPQPDFTMCIYCDGPMLPFDDRVLPLMLSMTADPVRVLHWIAPDRASGAPTGAAVDVTDGFTPALRAALLDREFVWIGASETIASLAPGEPRGYALSADATELEGHDALRDGVFDFAPSATRTGISARSGFATAYSLERDQVFVIGGRRDGRALDEMWTFSADGSWRRRPIARGLAPTSAQASVYSGADAHVWVVDGRGRGATLRWIDAATGEAAVGRLPELEAADRAWLASTATGEVLLVTNVRDRHVISRLRWGRSGPSVAATVGGGGVVAIPPRVRHGVIALGIRTRTGDVASVTPIAIPISALR